jgi:hypothetical protein
VDVVAATDAITVVQTVVLGLGTLLTYLSVRLAASQFREARAERREAQAAREDDPPLRRPLGLDAGL